MKTIRLLLICTIELCITDSKCAGLTTLQLMHAYNSNSQNFQNLSKLFNLHPMCVCTDLSKFLKFLNQPLSFLNLIRSVRKGYENWPQGKGESNCTPVHQRNWAPKEESSCIIRRFHKTYSPDQMSKRTLQRSVIFLLSILVLVYCFLFETFLIQISLSKRGMRATE